MKQIFLFVILSTICSLFYGQSANSLNFDGINDRVDIGNVIPRSSSYTKEAMVKTNNIQYKNIVTSSSSPFWFGGGKLQAGHGGGFDDVAANASAMVGVWTHVAVTYDALASTMKLYINGVKVDENNSVGAYKAEDIQIGAFNSGYFFNGEMDEVRIWNYVRSEAEITAHKDCELTGDESGLLAYYQFNQGIANSSNAAISTLIDNTANGNIGTLVNFTLSGAFSNWTDGSVILSGLVCGALKWEGESYTFDGTSQSATVPSDVLQGASNYTISTWVKADALQSGARIFDFGNSDTSYMYLTGKGGDNNIEFAITTTGSAGEEYISGTANAPLAINSWQHIAVVQNGTVGIVYLNGLEIARNSNLTLNITALGELNANYIGKSQNDDSFFEGEIKEFKVYDAALMQISDILIDVAKPTALSPVDSWIISANDTSQLLTWNSGNYFTSTNVYFGDSYDAVANSTSPLVSELALGINTIDLPDNLTEGEVYYWRVDELNGTEVRTGEVWKFKYVGSKLKVFLMAGQSNMVGWTPLSEISEEYKHAYTDAIVWLDGECAAEYARQWSPLCSGMGKNLSDFGPELSFGPEIARLFPDDNIALLKCAWGGTSLHSQWRSPSSSGATGNLYTVFVQSIKDGLAALPQGLDPEIAGMLWMQGEADSDGSSTQAYADEYESNLTHFISDIRAEVKRPEMPVVIGQIGYAPAWNAYGTTIRAAQLAVSQDDDCASMIKTNDYALTDSWHYNGDGVLSLGIRFAGAMETLLNTSSALTDVSNLDSYAMYPNPIDSNGDLHFELSNSTGDTKCVKIIDLQGRMLYSQVTHSENLTLNVSDIVSPNGLYLVIVEVDDDVVLYRLLIK